MVGRNSRTNALSRYLEALPQNETNNQSYPEQVNKDSTPIMNSYPYGSNHSSHDIHPLPGINSVLTDTNEIHTLSDVTSNSDLSEDQTLSLLSKEERVSHSQHLSNEPRQERERPKPFQSKFKRNSPGSNKQQQQVEVKHKLSTPSPNNWKDALRLHSKQKQHEEKHSPNTGEANNSISHSSQDKNENSTPSTWKNALRRKKSTSFSYQQHRDQGGDFPNDEEDHDQENTRTHDHGNEMKQTNNYNNTRSSYMRKNNNMVEKESDNRNQRNYSYTHNLNTKKQSSHWIPPTNLKSVMSRTPVKSNFTSNYENNLDQNESHNEESSRTDSVLSIQDRINRFSGKSDSVPSSHRQTRSERSDEYPIERTSYKQNYGNSNENYEDYHDEVEEAEDDDGDVPMAPSPSRIPPSPPAAAAADAAAELVRRSMSTPPRKNTTSYTNFNDASVKNPNIKNNLSKTPSKFPKVLTNSYGNVNLRDRSQPSRSRTNFENSNEKNTYANARSTLRSHSLPRQRVTPKNSQNTSSQSPFRFDIPDDQDRSFTPHQFSQFTRQTVQSTRQKAAAIQKETTNAIHNSPVHNNSNGSITSRTIGSSTQVSKDDIEKVMDRKLKLMEDRLAAQMNEKMEELESNMENKMNEIHALLLNLMDNRIHDRQPFP